MTLRGCTPRNDQRPKRWPCSADSSRKLGPAPRSFRYAETGVSQSSMNLWRRGTSVCSLARRRTSSRLGETSMFDVSATTAIERVEGVREGEAAGGEQHGQVVEQVGGLVGHALVALLCRRARDLLRLLLDLRADPWRIR